MAGSEIQLLYDVADASWQSHGRAVRHIVLGTNQVTATAFDMAKQRFVSLLAADTNGAGADACTDFVAGLLAKDPDITTKWFISTPKTMVVPAVLFDETMMAPLLQVHHKIGDGDSTGSYPVKRIGAQMLFAYTEFLESLKNRLRVDRFIPVDAPWLDCLHLDHKGTTGLHAHINVSHDFISLAVFKDEALQFYNTFLTATPEEVLYFVMFVGEQLRLNPQRDMHYFSGNIKKGDAVYTLLAKYISALQPEGRPTRFSYCMPMLDIPAQLFFNVYCTPLCE